VTGADLLIDGGVIAALRAGRIQIGLYPWLQYVAPAVLGALVGPRIAVPNGHIAAPGWELVAYVLAGFVAATTRRMVGALSAGQAALVLAALLQPP
jgi:branched-subunit amino acid transport protein